jgi:hypothetical protein
MQPLLMEFVMFDVSTDLVMAMYFLSLHTLIVWGAVMAWLWFSRMIRKLEDKRYRQNLLR